MLHNFGVGIISKYFQRLCNYDQMALYKCYYYYYCY